MRESTKESWGNLLMFILAVFVVGIIFFCVRQRQKGTEIQNESKTELVVPK
jgi:hypothetical protein